MTSFAFIFGVLPLFSQRRRCWDTQALGTAVFFGMLGVTG
jgi:multidrug efflux pump subunit AcrB